MGAISNNMSGMFGSMAGSQQPIGQPMPFQSPIQNYYQPSQMIQEMMPGNPNFTNPLFQNTNIRKRLPILGDFYQRYAQSQGLYPNQMGPADVGPYQIGPNGYGASVGPYQISPDQVPGLPADVADQVPAPASGEVPTGTRPNWNYAGMWGLESGQFDPRFSTQGGTGKFDRIKERDYQYYLPEDVGGSASYSSASTQKRQQAGDFGRFTSRAYGGDPSKRVARVLNSQNIIY